MTNTNTNSNYDNFKELEELRENFNFILGEYFNFKDKLEKYKSLGHLSRGLISVDGVTIEHTNGRGVIIKNRYKIFVLTDSDLLMLANLAGLFKGDK